MRSVTNAIEMQNIFVNVWITGRSFSWLYFLLYKKTSSLDDFPSLYRDRDGETGEKTGHVRS
jgi:hypothetical protein